MSTFGDRLKHLRTVKGLTQAEVALALRTKRETYANWELGRTEPDLETVQRIAEYFAVSADYLLGGTSDLAPLGRGITDQPAHRADGTDGDLPDEAKKELEAIKDWLRHKYARKQE